MNAAPGGARDKALQPDMEPSHDPSQPLCQAVKDVNDVPAQVDPLKPRPSVCCCWQALVLPTFLGILVGYLTYDCLHYAMHQGVGRRWPLLKQARPCISNTQVQRVCSLPVFCSQRHWRCWMD